MKTYRILLLVSLALNGLLYVLVRTAHPAQVSQRFSLSDRRPMIRREFQSPARSHSDRELWSDMARDLRAEGMPEAVTRAWIGAEIEERYRATKEAILQARKVRSVWEPEPAVSLEQRLALVELDREKARAMLDALGPDASLADSALYGFLAAEKRDEVKMELEYQNAYVAAYRENVRGLPTAAETAWIRSLESEKRQKLAALLSGPELEAVDMLSSPIAQRVRANNEGVPLTQNEFLAIYDYRELLDSHTRMVPGETMARALTQDEARVVENDLIQKLGTQRYGELMNYGARQLSALVDRSGLPSSAMTAIFQIRDSVAAQSLGIADDPSTGAVEKKAALSALAATARAQFTSVLGATTASAAAPVMEQWFGPLDRGMAVTVEGASMKPKAISSTPPTYSRKTQ
ncbi:MAG: hypothetical protein RIS56_1219 [Verrucomicrobiota bacterium]